MRFAPRWIAATPRAAIKKNEKEKFFCKIAYVEPMMTGIRDPARKGALGALK